MGVERLARIEQDSTLRGRHLASEFALLGIAMRQIRRLQGMKGWGLRAFDGEIGTLQQIYFDDAEWQVRYLVVRTGGWLFGRAVLIAPRVVTEVEEDQRRLSVNLSRKQIEESPPFDAEKPVSRHYEELYHRFYGWAPYWSGPGVMGIPLPVPMAERPPNHEPPRPHLRSSDEVVGYDVLARDGRLGHVEDLLVDDETWNVRYIEVDTRNWWPGKKVLVAPTWLDAVDWAHKQISVTLNRDILRDAPEYDPSVMITPEYEVELFQHYSRAAARETR